MMESQIVNFVIFWQIPNNHLISFRIKYALHPDYLFLMSEYLLLEERVYQAIDTLHTSLLIDYDDMFLLKNNFEKSSVKLINKKMQLFAKLFKIINNQELLKIVDEANSDQKILFFLINFKNLCLELVFIGNRKVFITKTRYT